MQRNIELKIDPTDLSSAKPNHASILYKLLRNRCDQQTGDTIHPGRSRFNEVQDGWNENNDLIVYDVVLTHKLISGQRKNGFTEYFVVNPDAVEETHANDLPGFKRVKIVGILKKYDKDKANVEYISHSNSMIMVGEINLAAVKDPKPHYEFLHFLHQSNEVTYFPKGVGTYKLAEGNPTLYARLKFPHSLVSYKKKDNSVGFQTMGPQFTAGGAKHVHHGLFSLVRRASGEVDLTRSRTVVKVAHANVNPENIVKETRLSKRVPHLHTKDSFSINFGNDFKTQNRYVIERELAGCDLSTIIQNERRVLDAKNFPATIEKSKLHEVKNQSEELSESSETISSDASSDSESHHASAKSRSSTSSFRSASSKPKSDVLPVILSTRDRLTLSIEVLYALKEQIHDSGTIHRDFKPENLRVNTNTQRVRIMDLGLGKDAGVTDPYEHLCSEWYIPLEALRNEPRTERSDVYSTGLSIAELWGMKRIFNTNDEARKYAESPTLPELFSFDDLTDRPLGQSERQHFRKILEKMILPTQSERCTVEEAIEQMEQVRLAYMLAQASETKRASIVKAHKTANQLRKDCYVDALAHKAQKNNKDANESDKSITPQDVNKLVQKISAALKEVDDTSEALHIFIDTAGVEAFRGMKTKDAIQYQLSYAPLIFEQITARLAELNERATKYVDEASAASPQMRATAKKILSMVAYVQKKSEVPLLTFDEMADTPGDPGLVTRLINKYAKYLAPLAAQFSAECDDFEHAQKMTPRAAI